MSRSSAVVVCVYRVACSSQPHYLRRSPTSVASPPPSLAAAQAGQAYSGRCCTPSHQDADHLIDDDTSKTTHNHICQTPGSSLAISTSRYVLIAIEKDSIQAAVLSIPSLATAFSMSGRSVEACSMRWLYSFEFSPQVMGRTDALYGIARPESIKWKLSRSSQVYSFRDTISSSRAPTTNNGHRSRKRNRDNSHATNQLQRTHIQRLDET